MCLAVHFVSMDFGSEGLLDGTHRSAERNEIASARDRNLLHVLTREPCGHLRNVGLRGSKTLRILFRRQPFMEIRGTWVLLLRQKRLQVRGLRGCGFQENRNMFQLERCIHAALIVSGYRGRANVPRKDNAVGSLREYRRAA